MNDHQCIDLEHLGLEGAIACYLVDGPEPAIVDPGPATTMERLIEELEIRGVASSELRHILLTHIHLDHAGATVSFWMSFLERVCSSTRMVRLIWWIPSDS